MKTPKNIASWVIIISFVIFSLLFISYLAYGIFISPPSEDTGYYFTSSSDFDPSSLPLSTRKKFQEEQNIFGFACIFSFLVFFGISLWAILFDEE